MAKNEVPKLKLKKDKNKKLLKRIDKALDRVEKQVTRLHQISQRLQIVRASYTLGASEKKAA